MNEDRRLIEDYLPIEAISKEASREKSVRKGHISTLHLWWARRPLVACRAAVYGALVPASRFIPENGPDNKKQSLGRANAAKFVERLCKYPGNPDAVNEAQRHILEAHAERLTEETGKKVTVEDIIEGRAPRPKVLDMFAGGGAIPLEALRLGCEAYALDLNPVAHIIELCTLVYPQKYGKPDPNARGMTGPKNAKGETTWGGLAEEVRYWGNWVLEKVKAEIGDLYPLIPDPQWKGKGGTGFQPVQSELLVTRRNLPHWQAGGSIYFVTFRTAGLDLNRAARELVLDACRHFDGQRYTLWAAVVMPDHVHLLLQPHDIEQGKWWPLSSILHSLKSFTAKEINKLLHRQGSVWQDESFDRIVRDEEEFLEKWNYIRNNPVAKGLCEVPEQWDGFYECTGKMPGSDSTGKMPGNNFTGKMPVPLETPPGYLTPVAYLWTRTVRCKNPTCGATVPLVRQTWLCKKAKRYVALRMVAPRGEKRVRFEVVESATEKGLGFDPAACSRGGNATCPFCGTVADSDYVKAEGRAKRMGEQMMSIVCTRPGRQGKIYLSADDHPEYWPDDEAIRQRIEALCQQTGLTVPSEPIEANPRSMDTQHFGFETWGDLFTPRQMLCLLTFAAAVREAQAALGQAGVERERAKAVGTYLAAALDKVAEIANSLGRWEPVAQCTRTVFGRQALPMVWDFGETVPIATSAGNWNEHLGRVLGSINLTVHSGDAATVLRGSATALPWSDASFDAVVTDPPYYDNVSYSNLSDFFYVWLKRTIGHLYPEHFASECTPKKSEIIAAFYRHNCSKEKARAAYERMMAQAFAEANRVLKPGGPMVVVYAHKTTLGWSTLVEALRRAGFTVTEAWPLDTEMKSRLIAMETASLASSIFLVARKRESSTGFQPVSQSTGKMPVPPLVGSYEDEVRPELEQIVRERVDSLWKMGIMGADLVISAVGAGLRAYTRFARVEYANGEEVPAGKFLAEVEGVVLETLLEKIFRLPRSGVSAVDGPSRFYVLWRFTYKAAEMEAGEAIVFTYGQGVELDGPNGLTGGKPVPLLEKKKGKYRLRDFTERGEDEKLGLPKEDGTSASLIDALHRILWLVENQPRTLNKFLDEARPDRERLRLVAQALAGRALSGGPDEDSERSVITTPAEQAALKKLLANWRALIEQRLAMDEGTLFVRRGH